MIVFFSNNEIIKKIEDICKVTGETQSQIIESAVIKFLSSTDALKVLEANSVLNRSQLNSVTKLKSSSKVLSLMSFLKKMDDSELSERYKKIISMRFGLGEFRPHTLEEIGIEFGVTRERIRQIIARLLIDPEDKSNEDLIDNTIDTVDSEDNYVYNDLIKNAEDEIRQEINKIIEVVARTFSKTTLDLMTKRRTADIAFVRQFSMYVLKQTLDLSAVKIGKIFHRDHTTVLHALNLINEKVINDQKFSQLFEKIIAEIPTYMISDNDVVEQYEFYIVNKFTGERVLQI